MNGPTWYLGKEVYSSQARGERSTAHYEVRFLNFISRCLIHRKKGGYGTSVRVVYLPRYRPIYLYSLRSAIERECVTNIASSFINTAALGNACSLAELESTLSLPSERAYITRSVLRALRPECGLRVETNETGEERVYFDARLYGNERIY